VKRENQLLKADNDSLRLLAEKLISHPAFMPFVNELSRDPQMAESLARVANPPQTSQQSSTKDQFQGQQFNQSNDVIVGMTLIPEVPIDLSSLNIGSNQWQQQLPHGIETYSNPQIFAVTEITPTAEPVDISALSGKEATENVMSRYMDVEEEKSSFPEISLPAKEIEEETVENVFDENNPNETLYAASKPSTKTTEQDQEPIFATLQSEKAFARYELVVTSEADEEVFESELKLKFARLEASFRTLETLTSRYRC